MRRLARAAAATLVATAALAALQTGTASATPGACPGGEATCVYLPAGTYTLGNPVTYNYGFGPSTRVVLNRCDSTGANCDHTDLNLPGVALTSTPSTLLTLTVPGEGVGLSGLTPTLYVGLPGATLGSPALGLTLHVQGTTFVVTDTAIGTADCLPLTVPANTYVNGTYSACGVDLTVTV
jgi:hypothetical protein